MCLRTWFPPSSRNHAVLQVDCADQLLSLNWTQKYFPLWMWINHIEVLSKSNLHKSPYLSSNNKGHMLQKCHLERLSSIPGLESIRTSYPEISQCHWHFVEAEQAIPERTWGHLFEPVCHILPFETLRDDFLTDPMSILKICFNDRTAVRHIEIEI